MKPDWVVQAEEDYGQPIEEILREAVAMASEIQQTQREFAEEVGVHPSTIYTHLRKLGLRWPLGIKSPATVADDHSPWARIYITHRGVRKSLTGWAKETGVPYSTLYRRIRDGWDPVEAITKPQISSSEMGRRNKHLLQPGWKGYRRG